MEANLGSLDLGLLDFNLGGRGLLYHSFPPALPLGPTQTRGNGLFQSLLRWGHNATELLASLKEENNTSYNKVFTESRARKQITGATKCLCILVFVSDTYILKYKADTLLLNKIRIMAQGFLM